MDSQDWKTLRKEFIYPAMVYLTYIAILIGVLT